MLTHIVAEIPVVIAIQARKHLVQILITKSVILRTVTSTHQALDVLQEDKD